VCRSVVRVAHFWSPGTRSKRNQEAGGRRQREQNGMKNSQLCSQLVNEF
jgi:hypothetical protein